MGKYNYYPCEHCTEVFKHSKQRVRHMEVDHPHDIQGDRYNRNNYICSCCLKEHKSAQAKKDHEHYMRKKAAKKTKKLSPSPALTGNIFGPNSTSDW